MWNFFVNSPMPPTPPITAPIGMKGRHLLSGPGAGVGTGVGVGVGISVGIGVGVGGGDGGAKFMGMVVMKSVQGGFGILSVQTNSRNVEFL